MTTLAAFIDDLEALSVTDVVRRYSSGPPVALNAADLPAQWVQLPTSDETSAYAGVAGQAATLSAELVIAVEAVGQNTQLANFDATIAMMDNVIAALRDHTPVTKGPLGWRLRLAGVLVAGTAFWAVVADISAMD